MNSDMKQFLLKKSFLYVKLGFLEGQHCFYCCFVHYFEGNSLFQEQQLNS